MGDAKAGGQMKANGQGLVALAVAALIAGGVSVAKGGGPAVPAGPPPAGVHSNVWLCPHGGGDGWSARIAVADPGPEAVRVRLTSIDRDGPGTPVEFEVPAGGEVVRKVPAEMRSSSTYVEVFGGWAAAGWLVRAGGRESGSAAEPCAPAAARRWYAPELTTQRGEEGRLVVMNPFASDAVFDVVLYTPDRPPFRDPDWVDMTLEAGRSLSLRVDEMIPGEDVAAAEILVKSGRVAAATVGFSEAGGVRAALGSTTTAPSWLLPTAGGTGQDTLIVSSPGELGIRFGASLLSEQPPQPAGGLVQQEQALQSARAYPVVTSGPSAVEVSVQEEQAVVTALRAAGPGADSAASAGTAVTSVAWVVLPTIDGDPYRANLVVVNPGEAPVTVTLTPLGRSGIGVPGAVTLEVPATSAVAAPAPFVRDAADAAILVEASGEVVAFGSATSGGRDGRGRFALALGVPLPSDVL